MRPVSASLGVAVVAALLAVPARAQTPLLDRVRVDLVSIADSQSYFVYRYRISNPAASRAGLAALRLDLSAPSGTGFVVLPATGVFRHGAAAGGAAPAIDHVPVGPLTPPSWRAWLLRRAVLQWYGASGGLTDDDSIPPGGGLGGFGLRSPYLPGIRTFSAEPTWQSCCSVPRPAAPDVQPGEHPGPADFQVMGSTVAPTVAPGSLEIGGVRGFLDRSCGSIGWITNAGVCNGLRTKLDEAAAALAANNIPTARAKLQDFLAELDAQRGTQPGKHVTDNAYWLLKVNAEALLARL